MRFKLSWLTAGVNCLFVVCLLTFSINYSKAQVLTDGACATVEVTSYQITSAAAGSGTAADPAQCPYNVEVCVDLLGFNELALNWVHGMVLDNIPAGAIVTEGSTGNQATSDGQPNQWIWVNNGPDGTGFYVDYDIDAVTLGYQGDGDVTNNFGDQGLGTGGAAGVIDETYLLEPFCFNIEFPAAMCTADGVKNWRPSFDIVEDGTSGNHPAPHPVCSVINIVCPTCGPNGDGFFYYDSGDPDPSLLCGGGSFIGNPVHSGATNTGTCEDPYTCDVTYNFCFDVETFGELALNWLHGVSIINLPDGATVAAGATGVQQTADGLGNQWIFIDDETFCNPGTPLNTQLPGPGFFVDDDSDGNPCNGFGDQGNSGALIAIPEVFDGSTGTGIDLAPFCFNVTLTDCTVSDCWRPLLVISGDGESGNHIIDDPGCLVTGFSPNVGGTDGNGNICYGPPCPNIVANDITTTMATHQTGDEIEFNVPGGSCGLGTPTTGSELVLDFYVYAPGGVPGEAPGGYGTPVGPATESQNPTAGFTGAGGLDCGIFPDQLQCDYADLEIVQFDATCGDMVSYSTNINSLLSCPADITISFFAYVFDHNKNCGGGPTTTEYRSNCDIIRIDVPVSASAPTACESTSNIAGTYNAATHEVDFVENAGGCNLGGNNDPGSVGNEHVIDLYVYAPNGNASEAPGGYTVDVSASTESANPLSGFVGTLDCDTGLFPDQVTCKNEELQIVEFDIGCGGTANFDDLGSACAARTVTFYALIFDYDQDCDGDGTLEYASNCSVQRIDVTIAPDISPDFSLPATVAPGATANFTANGGCSGVEGLGAGNNGIVVDLYVYAPNGAHGEAPGGYSVDVQAPTESSNGLGAFTCAGLPDQFTCRNPELVNVQFDGTCDAPPAYTPDFNTCADKTVTLYLVVFDYNRDTDSDLTSEYNPNCTVQRFDITVTADINHAFQAPMMVNPGETATFASAGCSGIDGLGNNDIVADLYVYAPGGVHSEAPGSLAGDINTQILNILESENPAAGVINPFDCSLPALDRQITCQFPTLENIGFDYTCAMPPTYTPDFGTCEDRTVTLFTVVYDYDQNLGGDPTRSEYNINCTVLQHDIIVKANIMPDFSLPTTVAPGATANFTANAGCQGVEGTGAGNNGIVVDLYVYAPDGIHSEAPGSYSVDVSASTESANPNPLAGFAGPLDCDALPDQITCKNPELVALDFDGTCAAPLAYTPDFNTCSDRVVTLYLVVFDYNLDNDGDGTLEYNPACTVQEYNITVTAGINHAFQTPATVAANSPINFTSTGCAGIDGTPGSGGNGIVVDLYVYAPNGAPTQAPNSAADDTYGASINAELLNVLESNNPVLGAINPIDCAVDPLLARQISCSFPELEVIGFDFTCASPPTYTPDFNACSDQVITLYTIVYDYNQNLGGDPTRSEYNSYCTVLRHDVTITSNLNPDFAFVDQHVCSGGSVEMRPQAGCSGLDFDNANGVVVDLYVYAPGNTPGSAPAGHENTIDVSPSTESQNPGSGFVQVSVNGSDVTCVASLADQIQCKNPELDVVAFDLDCAANGGNGSGGYDINVPTNRTCDILELTYFTIVYDYNANFDGDTQSEYNPYCGMSIQRHDITIYPENFDIQITPPDCDGNAGSIVITADDNSTCPLPAGLIVTNTAGNTGTNDGRLTYNSHDFFPTAPAACQQSITGDDIVVNCAVVPVILNYFDANKNGKTNVLTWETASEIGTEKFIIERSADGRNFEQLGEVAALGESDRLQKYTWVDQNPIGKSYYRIKMVDFDGYFEYSGIRYLERRLSNASKLQITPNPAVDQIIISDIELGSSRIEIITLDGKVLESIQFQSETGEKTLSIGHLPAGMYIIKAITNGNNKSTKFAKI